jgi:hypothetical protein
MLPALLLTWKRLSGNKPEHSLSCTYWPNWPCSGGSLPYCYNCLAGIGIVLGLAFRVQPAMPQNINFAQPVTIITCRKTSKPSRRRTPKIKKSSNDNPKTTGHQLRLTGGNPQTEPFREIRQTDIKIPLKKSPRN